MAPDPPAAAVSLGPLLPRDIREVSLIEKLSFSSPWDLDTFNHILSSGERTVALAARGEAGETAGRIFGYAFWDDLGEEYHIINLAVHPDYRRRRVGSLLLRHIVNRALAGGAERLTLEVRLSNEGAIAFYEARGFIPVAIRQGYYRDDGGDALVMWLRPLRH